MSARRISEIPSAPSAGADRGGKTQEMSHQFVEPSGADLIPRSQPHWQTAQSTWPWAKFLPNNRIDALEC